MYSKIAFKNVQKSFKDYTIYFLTLTLAVCIFYSFNSIESQTAFMQMEESTSEYVEMLSQLTSYLSVFVSFILGSLILYANNFLIKKRKKELGIYTILGMSRQHVSKILVLETLLVGALSLVSGLALGLIASQGLSIFTAKLFEVTMSEFHFIISGVAIGKTILYFGMMFLLVILFNTVVISRYKVIELLNANKKIEVIKARKPVFYFIVFIASLTSLFFAYAIILKNGMVLNSQFMTSVLFGIAGTFLFFFSLANMCLIVLQKNKGAYYKGLNTFITKQMSSKVHTNYVSISIISLMLFLTIGILSTGISYKSALEADLEKATPFSASAYLYVDDYNPMNDINKSLMAMGYSLPADAETVNFTEYSTLIPVQEFLSEFVSESGKKTLEKYTYHSVTLISESDYNRINTLAKRSLVTLAEDEVLVLSNVSDANELINEFLKNNDSIVLNDKTLKLKNKTAIEDALYSASFKTMLLSLVVKDELAAQFEPYMKHLNINFNHETELADEKDFSKALQSYLSGPIDTSKVDFINGYTRTEIYDMTKGMTTTILFVGIYLGIVFLISSMAVLALQQLSEASDSIDRYRALKKIGATETMINKSIFIQTIIYFTLPIALALVHSVVGITVVNEFITMLNKPNIGASASITALIFLTVYLGYFYATYTGYKNIVKQS